MSTVGYNGLKLN